MSKCYGWLAFNLLLTLGSIMAFSAVVRDLRVRLDAAESCGKALRAELAAVRDSIPAPCSCGVGAVDDGKMGAGPIQTAKDTNERVNALVIRFGKMLDEVEAGRLGFHIEGSLWAGKFDVTAVRK